MEGHVRGLDAPRRGYAAAKVRTPQNLKYLGRMLRRSDGGENKTSPISLNATTSPGLSARGLLQHRGVCGIFTPHVLTPGTRSNFSESTKCDDSDHGSARRRVARQHLQSDNVLT